MTRKADLFLSPRDPLDVHACLRRKQKGKQKDETEGDRSCVLLFSCSREERERERRGVKDREKERETSSDNREKEGRQHLPSRSDATRVTRTERVSQSDRYRQRERNKQLGCCCCLFSRGTLTACQPSSAALSLFHCFPLACNHVAQPSGSCRLTHRGPAGSAGSRVSER